ncbi:Defensin-like protein 289 [Raphanus sativus]|nr:Defensin-like protein 289 [Raphanus sativus]
MAASKTTIFIFFILCFSGTLLVNVSGQGKGLSCSTSKNCELLCFTGAGRGRGECVHGKCSCLGQKAETKLVTCKTNRDCPPSRDCPRKNHNVCLLGECVCIPT